MIFHVLNRGNARDQIFDQGSDYAAFEKVLAESQEQVSVRILSETKPVLCPWPIPRPADWVTRVNRALTKKEIEAVQASVVCRRLFGSELARNHRNATRLAVNISLTWSTAKDKARHEYVMSRLFIGLIPFTSLRGATREQLD